LIYNACQYRETAFFDGTNKDFFFRGKLSSMEINKQPHTWNPSNSLYQIDFEARPVLSDMSMVIPTLGRPILEQCLYYILAGDAWPGCLIVVDQGASQKAAGWLEHLRRIGIRTRHIISEQHGRSAGINRGLEQVDTRFVVITDDDCFITVNWLTKMETRGCSKNPIRLSPGALISQVMIKLLFQS
jgi:hypothetical protein